MKNNKIKISDLYPISDILDTTINKVFYYLSQVEILEDVVPSDDVATLDNDYYLNHSNDKYVSPLVEKLFNDGKTSAEISNFVASICVNRFAKKWKKIYDALVTEYNPLDNYAMEEIRTPDLTDGETQNEESKVKTERTTDATNSYKGFNADQPVVVNKTDGTENVETSGAKLDNKITKSTTHTGTETLTRSGNIGVTSSQQMLTQELEVRKYDFYQELFNDIDSIYCLSIY